MSRLRFLRLIHLLWDVAVFSNDEIHYIHSPSYLDLLKYMAVNAVNQMAAHCWAWILNDPSTSVHICIAVSVLRELLPNLPHYNHMSILMIKLILSMEQNLEWKSYLLLKISQSIINGKVGKNNELIIILNSNQFIIIFTSTFTEHIKLSWQNFKILHCYHICNFWCTTEVTNRIYRYTLWSPLTRNTTCLAPVSHQLTL